MDKWFGEKCRELEEEHGRGWKRRLAEMVGVSDSNVQSWIKAGSVPPAVRTAIEKAQYAAELEAEIGRFRSERHLIAEIAENDFHLLELSASTGRYIPHATFRRVEDAHALIVVRSGELDRRIAAVCDRFEILADNVDDKKALHLLENWREITRPEKEAGMSKICDTLFNEEDLDNGK